MVNAAGCEFKRSADIFGFKVGMFRKNPLAGHSGREKVQNVGHAEAQTPNTGAPAAFSWL
jgi:hypothetical protein